MATCVTIMCLAGNLNIGVRGAEGVWFVLYLMRFGLS